MSVFIFLLTLIIVFFIPYNRVLNTYKKKLGLGAGGSRL
jgi:hypothetical protein